MHNNNLKIKPPEHPLKKEYYHRRLTEWICNSTDNVQPLMEEEKDPNPTKNEKDIFVDNYFLNFIHLH